MTQRILTFVLPPHFSQLSVREKHRYELWAKMSLYLLGSVLVIFIHLAITAPEVILIPILHISVYSVSLLILKFQGSIWYSVSFSQVGNFMLSLYLLLMTGGVLSPFLWIMGGVPILPALLLDTERDGKIWVATTIIGVFCIGFSQYMGLSIPLITTSSYLTFTMFASTIPLIVYVMIYLTRKERMYMEQLLLDEKNVEMQHSNLLHEHLLHVQLQYLRSQIQPHFLFNTLNSITALIRWNKQEQAIEAVNNLAEILRFTLQDPLEDLIPLREEINVISQYIALEKIRFGDKISFTLHIPEKLQNILIPCFSVQLLVENSIQHGFQNFDSRGQIVIEVREFLSESPNENLLEKNVTISVQDNGIGLPQNWSRSHFGVGLHNLEERLHLLFGTRASLQFQPNSPKGTIALITITYSE